MFGRLQYLLLISLLIGTFDAFSSELPYQAFSRLKQYSSVKISPDGTKLAFIRNVQKTGMAVLTSYSLVDGEMLPLAHSDNEKILIRWFEWANNETILLGARYAGKRYRTDTIETRLMAVDVKKVREEPRLLIRPRSSTMNRKNISQFQDRVLDVLPDDRDHILVQLDLDKFAMPSVYKLNIYTRKKSRIEKGKRHIRSWKTDRQNNLRLGSVVDYKTGERSTLIRKVDDKKWHTYFEYNGLNEPAILPVGFALNSNILYFKKYKDDMLALYKINLDTNEEQLVFHDPKYDVDGRLIYSSKSNDVIGIHHRNSSTGRIYWDESWADFQMSLDDALPETNNYLIDLSKDETKYVLYTENDTTPGTFYIGDRSKNTLKYLFEQYPELIPEVLTEHERIVYNARDGIEIEGYLTLPNNAGGPVATIIHPHGGPRSRDSDGFDYWTSFFANRGYAVFRPNFRGSAGYGYDFAQRQVKRWGLEMQDDLEDAVNYLTQRGITDKNRVCIVGASYGGYAAMMGIVKTPKLYKCAVSFAGVSNLRMLVKDSRQYLNREFIENQLGDDLDDLKARSPYYGLDNINVPLLLLHGEKDRIVDVKHSRMMADEMEDQDKMVEYIELENGTHYLSIQRNRHKAFEAMDRFLKLHLK